MQRTNYKNIQWFLALFLMTICLNAFSQKAIIWKGGTPGMKNEWNCPQNWNTSSVPDEFSDVIIPDVSTSSFALPVLHSGKIEVNSLFIRDNGSLTITRDAALIVLGNAEGINQVIGVIIHKDEPFEMMKTMIGRN